MPERSSRARRPVKTPLPVASSPGLDNLCFDVFNSRGLPSISRLISLFFESCFVVYLSEIKDLCFR